MPSSNPRCPALIQTRAAPVTEAEETAADAAATGTAEVEMIKEKKEDGADGAAKPAAGKAAAGKAPAADKAAEKKPAEKKK